MAGTTVLSGTPPFPLFLLILIFFSIPGPSRVADSISKDAREATQAFFKEKGLDANSKNDTLPLSELTLAVYNVGCLVSHRGAPGDASRLLAGSFRTYMHWHMVPSIMQSATEHVAMAWR